MTSAQIGIMIAIIVYMISTIAIGLYFSRKSKTTGDFYLGGRKLGPFVTAMSAEASDMSAYLLMGLPGLAYFTGSAEVFWTITGLAVGTYLNWLLVAKRLRTYSATTGSITIPDFFADRFRDKKVLRCVAALIIIIFFVPYTASGFAACGKLFHSLFGANYHVAMIASAIVIVLYTTLGGFLAASTTDFVQGIIMTIALIAIVVFGVITVGGVDKVIAIAKDVPGYLSLTAHLPKGPFGKIVPESFNGIAIVSTLAWGLGYFGMPHILLRFMAIEKPSKVKLSRRVASIWVVISMFIALFIGIVGYAMTMEGKIPKLTDGSVAETVISEISKLLSTYGFVFAILAGVVLAGILASTMSTSDSQLLAASSSVSENMVEGVFGIKLSAKLKMIVARVAVICISIIAMIIAMDPESNVFQIVSFAWAGFGATFGPVMLVSLFWKRANKYGVITGMIAGAVTIFVWKFVVRPIGGAFDIYELLPAFIVALVVIIIVSLITKKPDDEIVEEFESVKSKLHS
ncbi:MAG: sodium/proline symporter [Eubacterium sp.]|nr:sodium/proline symporter [Eubacterium sp.]